MAKKCSLVEESKKNNFILAKIYVERIVSKLSDNS